MNLKLALRLMAVTTVVGFLAGRILGTGQRATGARQPLAELQRQYLQARQHTLSIDGMSFTDAVTAQARYVRGEALELLDAACDLPANGTDQQAEAAGQHVRHEIADVVLSVVTLANLFGWFVEDCIAEKTEADRGRG